MPNTDSEQSRQTGTRGRRAAPLRAFLPIAVIAAGIAMLSWGARFHSQPVLVELETELPELPADLMGPPGPFGPAPPMGMPPAPTQTVTVAESEPRLVREVTVGGLTLLPSGELKRTYSGEAPAQCPT